MARNTRPVGPVATTLPRRQTVAQARSVVSLGLLSTLCLGVLGFATWACLFVFDVTTIRGEHRARLEWIETTDGLIERLDTAGTESVRLAAARGLDLLSELRASPGMNGRSGGLIASLSTDLRAVQEIETPKAEVVDSVREGFTALRAALDVDRQQLMKRVDERWPTVALLVTGAVALSVGLVLLLLLFWRASGALAEVRRRFASIVRGAREGLWEWNLLDDTANFSGRWYAIVGLTPTESVPSIDLWLDRVHPQDIDGVRGLLNSHLSGEQAFFEVDHRLRHGSNRYRWVRVRGVATTDAAGHPVAIAGSLADINQGRDAEEAASAGEFVDLSLRGIDAAVAKTTLDGEVLQVSSGLQGLVSQWPSIDTWWSQVLGAIRFPGDRICGACDVPEISGPYSVSLRGPHGRRQVFDLVFGPHDHASVAQPASRVVFVRDTTGETRAAEAAALEVKTDQYSVVDRVTGLADRRAFRKRISEALEDARERDSFDFAVVCLDLDGLGLVNDTLGSQAGDMLLQTIASRLKRTLGTADSLCRIGGDEFGIVLRGVENEEHATGLVSRLPIVIGDQVDLLGLEVLPTATVGAAIAHSGFGDAEEIILRAKEACRHAVQGGKGAVQIVHGPAARGVRKTLRLNSDLRRALERGEFRLHFQPIVPLTPGASRGFEALLRWSHPDFGAIGPGDFIPLAEATGAIVPIGLWVLRQACDRLVSWSEGAPAQAEGLMMSVNLSMRQLRERDLVEQLAKIIDDTGVDPARLKLEITESAVMENPEEAEHVLGRLKALGLGLWVDDFGTGYSSLAYLQRFPIDGLKIDRSFVAPVVSDESSQQIVTSIIELGHNLGFSVVAEGVETPEQLAFLKASGCDLAQGRYFSSALDDAAAERFIASLAHGKRVPDGTVADAPKVVMDGPSEP